MKKNWRTCLGLVLVLWTTTLAVTQKNTEEPGVLLKAAMQKAVAGGDLNGAIEIYKSIADTPGVSHATAATALEAMAGAYDKLGNTAEAQKAYERIIREFSDQATAVAEAKTALKTLATPNVSASLEATTKLTEFKGGAISPDGRYYTYLDFFTNPDAMGLALRDLTTSRVQRLVSSPVNDQPTWYPREEVFSYDGKQIAYSWVDDSGLAPTELRTVAVDSKEDTPPHVVLRDADFKNYTPFGWSADGTRVFVLLTRQDHTHSIAAVSVSDGRMDIIKLLDWKLPDKLTLSRDGRWIAYDVPLSKDSTNRNIFILSTDSKTESPLIQNPELETMPSWTPDGNAIVYLSDSSGAMGLWRVPVAGGKPKGKPVPIRSNTGRLSPLGFANDGTFFYSLNEKSSDIFAAEIDLLEGKILKPPTRITNRSGGYSISPKWSPDGTRLAYFTERVGGFLSLVLRSAASGDEHEFLMLFKEASGLTWFPDGKSVVYFAQKNTDMQILQRIDVETGKDLIRRTVQREGGLDPVVSSDGRSVYLGRDGKDCFLIRYDLDTGRDVEIFKGEAPVVQVVVIPGGQITFSSLDGKIRVMALSGGTARILQAPAYSNLVRASDDGKGLLVQQRSTGSNDGDPLWWVPLDGGAAQRIGTGGYPAIESMHPDWKQIAITRRGSPVLPGIWVSKNLSNTVSSQPAVKKSVFTAQIEPVTGQIRGAVTRLTASPTGWDARAAWSPDGNSIAFKRQTADNNYEIVVRSMQTGIEKVYARKNGATMGGGPPRWFPDGKGLLQVINDPGSPGQGGTGFERLDRSTGEFKLVAEFDFQSANPLTAFSPDGKTFYAVSNSGLVVLDLATGQKKVIALPKSGIREVTLSPDGRTLAIGYFPDSTGKATLARVAVDGSGHKEIYTGMVRYLSWTKDSKGILFGESDNSDNWRIMRIPATGAVKPEFTGLQVRGLETIEVSPDGARLAFSGVEVVRASGGR